MPEFINYQTTGIAYSAVLTLGPAPDVDLINFSVFNQPALVQLWSYDRAGKWALEGFERQYAANTYGAYATNCAGIRFRSAVPATPAIVTAELVYKSDPHIIGGSLSNVNVSSSGQISPVTGISVAGTILAFAGATAPSGFVVCDGTLYDGTNPVYTGLWSVIGTTYGGTGQSSFAVPDLRGRMIAGLAPTGHVDVATLGLTDGAALASRRPKHKHTNNGLDNGGGAGGSAGTGNSGNQAALQVGPQTNSPTDAPAYIVLNYIISLG